MHRIRLDPKISVSVVFVTAMFMSIMDSTIVNVALPSLARQLNVPSSSIDAVVIAYLVSLAVVMPASGWLGDRWGTKRILLLALTLFTIASAMCGLASSYGMLIIFRVLQGAAGGALTPVGTAMLYRTFPPSERVQVSRVLIFATILAPALGPIIGGLLVTQLSWRWVFYVNVPIGILASLFGLIFLYEHKEKAPGRFDIMGFLLAGAGLPLLMYALSEGPSSGWSSINIFGSAILGTILLIAFVVVELKVSEPMIDLRLLRDRLFRSTNLVSFFSYAGFLGVLFIAPLYLQEARGVSALVSGLTTFPEAIGVVLSTQLVARLYPRIGPRRLMAGGLTGVAILMALLTLMGQDTNLWVMRALMFLLGAGMAYAFLPLRAAAFATISSTSTGRASAFYSAQTQLGSALGVAILGSVLSFFGPTTLSASGAIQPNLLAYHAAFLVAAVLALIAACIALTVSDKDAVVTMRRESKTIEQSEVPEIAESTDAAYSGEVKSS
ncbi:MAG TPA: MDR family MFS transporter [Ktedonobacteraceae bacterium]|nr:MDR family MFS transporter [Ktedonobacteraceae bacterium]